MLKKNTKVTYVIAHCNKILIILLYIAFTSCISLENEKELIFVLIDI